MDTRLKERLVGAAVLVALAVILIPEMLSGPSGRDDADTQVASSDEQGVKRYTIDLAGQSRPVEEPEDEAAPAEQVIEAAAPPAEAVPAPPDPQTVEAPPAASPPPAAAAVAAPPATPVPAAPEPATTVAPPRPAAEALPWVVQVGSFANQATAERLSADLKRRGYDSFVVPFRQPAQTLYRVRVGPMRQRSDADAIVQKLKREGTGATVVANG